MRTPGIGRFLVVAVAALGAAGCGTRTVPDTRSTAAPAADAGVAAPNDEPMLKVAIVELQLEGGRIWISITNEVGATDLVEVGSFPGDCKSGADTGGDPESVRSAIFAVDCPRAGSGVRLRFLHREGDLIVLRAPEVGGTFEMFSRVSLPRDARLRFGE